MNNDHVRNGPLVAGTVLIGLGLLSLASQLFRNAVNWSYLWPFAVIVFGGLFFAGMFLGGRQFSGLAIPGTIIGGIGLTLLYQSLSRNWESWSYSWALIIVFVGLGIYLAGMYGGSERQKHSGWSVMKVGFILFVIFGAFFEMIFSMDRTLGMRGLLFPALLIVLGIVLVVQRLGLFGPRDEPRMEPPAPPEPPASNQ